jgi:hypothetical protein
VPKVNRLYMVKTIGGYQPQGAIISAWVTGNRFSSNFQKITATLRALLRNSRREEKKFSCVVLRVELRWRWCYVVAM